MALKEKLKEELKTALKEKDELKTGTLRMLLSSIVNKEIELKQKEEGLSDEEVLKVLRTEAKKRRDSIEAFEKGGRTDLSLKENKELDIIKNYLPPEVSDEDIEKAVKDTMDELKPASMKDFGKVMKAAMEKLKGQADGQKVSAAIKKYF